MNQEHVPRLALASALPPAIPWGLPWALAGALCVGLWLPGAPASAQSVSAERGREVAARWCTACHATGTTAQAGDVGPTFEEIAARRSDDFLRGFLSNPHVRGSMPPFELAREHVADLVAYIRSLE